MNFSDCSILDIDFLFEMRLEGVVVSQVTIRLANVEMVVVGAEGGADELVAVAVGRPSAGEVRLEFVELELTGGCRYQPPAQHLALTPHLPHLNIQY